MQNYSDDRRQSTLWPCFSSSPFKKSEKKKGKIKLSFPQTENMLRKLNWIWNIFVKLKGHRGKLSAFAACPHLVRISINVYTRKEFLTSSKSRARCRAGGAGRQPRPWRTERMTPRSRVHNGSSCV